MSTPDHQHPIDPLSETLGGLRAGQAALEQRLDRFEHTVERRFAEMRWWLVALAAWLSGVIALAGWMTRA